MTATLDGVWYRGPQIESDGGGRGKERAMEDQDDGVDISITDEVQSDMDLIAGTIKGKDDGYVEQD